LVATSVADVGRWNHIGNSYGNVERQEISFKLIESKYILCAKESNNNVISYDDVFFFFATL
jgi:hypothetical protein